MIKKVLLGITAAALISIAFLPTILSSQWGKERIIGLVNGRIPGSISFSTLNVGWSSPLTLDGLILKDRDGKEAASVKSVQLNKGLWRLILDREPGPFQVNDLELDLIVDNQGGTNIEQALIKGAPSLGPSAEPLKIAKTTIRYTGNEIEGAGETLAGQERGFFTINGKGSDYVVKVQNFPVQIIDSFAGLKNPSLRGQVVNYLGKTLSLDLTLNGREASLSLKTPTAVLDGTGKLEGNQFILTKPLKGDINLPQGRGSMILNKLSGPINSRNPDGFDILGDLALNDIKVNLSHAAETKNYLAAIEAFGMKGELDLNDVDWDKRDAKGVLKIADIDYAGVHAKNFAAPFEVREGEKLLYSLSIESMELPYLDSAGTLQAHGDLSQKGSGEIAYLFKSPEVNAKGALSLTRFSHIETKGPVEVFVNIRPERVLKLSNGRVKLEEPFKAELKILSGKFADPILNSSINLTFATDPIHFKNFKMESVSGEIVSENLSQNINFNIKESSKLYAKGSASLNSHALNLDVNVDNYPLTILTALLGEDYYKKAYALFGPVLKGQSKAQISGMQGPVSLSLKGERCDLRGDGRIENNSLVLTKPLTLDIVMSKEISENILKEFIPLFDSALSADNPIKLTIMPDGFRMPLKDFSVLNTEIGLGIVDLGKIYFSRNGKLAEILSLLKLSSGEKFSVWATPVYFNLLQGVFQMNRFDILVSDLYPMAIWGNIDFGLDRIAMTIGLTGRTLSQAFGFKGLPKNYVLALPLKGPTSSPRLETAKITAKLAALASMAAGPQGLIIAGLLELASEKTPPPTTDPLPWDTDAEESPLPNPIKGIEKGAKKLIKNLLGE